MRKAAVILILLILLLTPRTARSEPVGELIEDPERFDGLQVSFSGEVIGVMIRGENAWVNILDEGYAIGIWCSAEDAKSITYVGDYLHIGDYVSGEGIYNVACIEHDGDTDIHASLFRVLEIGRTIERTTNLFLVLASIAALAIAVLVSFYLWRIRNEQKKIFPWPSY